MNAFARSLFPEKIQWLPHAARRSKEYRIFKFVSTVFTQNCLFLYICSLFTNTVIGKNNYDNTIAGLCAVSRYQYYKIVIMF